MSSALAERDRARRRGARLFLLVAVLAPAAVAGALIIASTNAGNDAPAVAPPVVAAPPATTPQDTNGAAAPGQPRLEGVDAFRVHLRKPPKAGLVFDLRSGEVLWRRNPTRRLPIASLTKMMTAQLVAERTRPRERFRVAPASFRYSGSGMGVLPKRRRVRLETLLYGLMIVSGNDAAIALSHHVAGNQRRFVRLMNRRARSLGLRCTRFVDSHGLRRGNRSCAADLAALARVNMRTRRIARVVSRRRARFRFPTKGGWLDLYSHNPLIRSRYPGAIGLKTGYTDAAGRCFVGVVRRRGRTLGVVLLDSPDPLAQSRRLLAAAYGDPVKSGRGGGILLHR